MNSIKCPQCGLVSWATTQACKRCGQPFIATYNTPTQQQFLAPYQPNINQQTFYQTQPQHPFVEQTNSHQQTGNGYDYSQTESQPNQNQQTNFQSTYGATKQTQDSYSQNYSQDYQQNYQQNNNQSNYYQPNYNQPNYGHNTQYGQGYAPNFHQQHYRQPFNFQRKKGLATASMILGICSLVLCGLFGVGPVVGIVLGIIALNKIKKEPDEYGGQPMAIAGIALSGLALFIVFIFFARVASTVPSNITASYNAANESSAISSMRTLLGAEMTYQATKGQGQYGTLQELGKEGLIDSSLSKGEKNGYRFSVTVHQKYCEIFATPVNNTSGRSFYISTGDGIIRAAKNGGLPASANDPPLDSTGNIDSFDDEDY